ncbi:MAG: GTPase ObgE [Planctomycetota bacterium]|nr:GTPase ObgE [Planctomycetota bacterium]
MFVDEARIYVKGGDGGDGCVAFRREKFVPFGGPDGGDGGDGGSVYLVADSSENTLLSVARKVHFIAENGKRGGSKSQSGKGGADLFIPVPLGTVVRDEDGNFIGELLKEGERLLVARGGKGGRGNKAFATATNRAPNYAEDGGAGEEKWVLLELKLLAEVGLVGLPNAGKSTLLSAASNAHPRIADYPFTTKSPVLGIVEVGRFQRIVVADLPGLIEGAHKGKGLGDRFLRHIERTKLLIHLIDIASPISSPLDAYRIIRKELESYSPVIARKEEIIALNKCDLLSTLEAQKIARSLKKEIQKKEVFLISAVSGKGVKELFRYAHKHLYASH